MKPTIIQNIFILTKMLIYAAPKTRMETNTTRIRYCFSLMSRERIRMIPEPIMNPAPVSNKSSSIGKEIGKSPLLNS